MKRHKFRKPVLTGAAAVLATTLVYVTPVTAASAASVASVASTTAASTPAAPASVTSAAPVSPWGESTPAAPAVRPSTRADVSVYFQDYGISFPAAPVIVHERMMVPGETLLQGLGYETTWDARDGRLTATQAGKISFVFESDRLKAEVDGKTVQDLPAAPFVRDDILWIPLRMTLEACGMTVEWDAVNRMAVVKDPQALPKFSVAVRAADQSLAGQPAKLEAALKEALEANASIDLIGPEHYRDKINLMIAAGDLKSLMLIPNIGQFPDSLIPSIAMDLTDLLDDYPRLKELALQSERGGYTSDGHMYGIPLPQDPHDAPFPAVRQDWLNVLGLAQPKTMDEMFEVLKVFTKQDPDGNGKHDTYGMTGYTTAAGLGSFAWVEQAYTGSPERFSVKNGQVVDHAVGEDETKALAWLTRAYEEGLIDKEFPVLSSEQAMDRLHDNRAGIATLSLNDTASLSADKVNWIPLTGLKADSLGTPIAPWATQDAGTYIVTKMSKIDPKLILAWLERGIEISENSEWDKADAPGGPLTVSDRSAIRSLFGSSDLLQDVDGLPSLSDTDRDAYEAAIKEWRNTSYEGTLVPGIDKLWSSGQYAELNSKLEQLKIKVILGMESIDSWNKYVQEMTASDAYKQMIADLNQLVAK